MSSPNEEAEWYEVFHSMRGRYLDLVAQIEAFLEEAMLCFLDLDPPREEYVLTSVFSRMSLNEKLEALSEALTTATLREPWGDLITRLRAMRDFRNRAAHDRVRRSMERVEGEDGAVGVRSSTGFQRNARGERRVTDVSREDFEARIAEAEQIFNDVAFGLREDFLEFAKTRPRWEKM